MLWLPPSAFREVQNNLPATPSTTAPGTTVAASGTINTKGSWVQLLTTNFDVGLVCFHFLNPGAGANAFRTLMDIGIGPAAGGSEQIILPDLLVSSGNPLTTAGFSRELILPLYIPKGMRLSARCQSVTASRPIEVNVFCWGGGKLPSMPKLVGADAYGIVSASSAGTTITAGSTGVESAWTNIGSTTSKAYKALFLMQGIATDLNMTNVAYHTEVGYNSGSPTLGEYYFVSDQTEHFAGPLPPVPIFAPVPSGTQLQIRSECSGAAEILDAALYGLY